MTPFDLFVSLLYLVYMCDGCASSRLSPEVHRVREQAAHGYLQQESPELDFRTVVCAGECYSVPYLSCLRLYISSAPEKPNTRMRNSGLEFGRRTSLRETIQSNRPTTPRAGHLRRTPRRVRDHDYDVCRHTAPKFRLFHAPANSAQVIAAVHQADHATVTLLSPQTQN